MCNWCGKRGCRPARPLCRKMRAKTEKYRKCDCYGYHFPHRKGSGACVFGPDHAKKQWERNTGLSWDTGEPIGG